MKLNFSVGDYVDTKINGYAHIVDILKSDTSDRTAVCVEFTYNFPNPRGFDIMIFTSEKTYGMDQWFVVDKKLFDDALMEKATALVNKASERINERNL